MSNKLLHQQLKNIIRSLQNEELEQTLRIYEQLANLQLEKLCRVVSYKCFEASIIYKGKKSNGYGRSAQEATANCTKNLFEFLLEDDRNTALIMQALKKDQYEAPSTTSNSEKAPGVYNTATNHGNTTTAAATSSSSANMNHRVPPRCDKANNSIALNLSIHQNCDTSFDLKGDIEALSKNIGNISMINNSKVADNANVSQLEMDDLILKMMLDNPEKAKNFKDLTSTHSHHNPTAKYSSENHQRTNAFGPSLKKTAPPEIDSRLSETKSALRENKNVQNQAHSSYSRSHSTHTLQQNSKQSTTLASSDKENRQDSHNIETTNPQRTTSTSNSNGTESLEQQSYGSKSKCSCGAAEELARARIKLEHYEKKIQQLMDENKLLKALDAESKEKETYKSSDMMSTMSTQLNSHHRSALEKTNTHHELLSQQENTDSIQENAERQPIPKMTEKQRSQSVDVHSRRKALEPSNGMDVSRDSEKRDMKKMIPRLRLDRLPNYHLKNQKTAQPPVPGLNLNAASLSSTNPNLSSNSSTNKQATLLQHTIGHSHYNFSGSSALGYSHATLNSSSLQKLMSQK